MQIRKLMNVIFLAGAFLFFGACKYATITPDLPPDSQVVSFSNDILPYYEKNCAGCHKPGGPAPDLTDANAYQSLVDNGLFIADNAEGSILYQKISTGSMAQFSNANHTQLTKNWINQGGKNN